MADINLKKLDQYLSHPERLTRQDYIWILYYIKHAVDQEDAMLMGLSQRRLLQNFSAFAEIALHLVHHPLYDTATGDFNDTRLLREACYGLDSTTRRELQTD